MAKFRWVAGAAVVIAVVGFVAMHGLGNNVSGPTPTPTAIPHYTLAVNFIVPAGTAIPGQVTIWAEGYNSTPDPLLLNPNHPTQYRLDVAPGWSGRFVFDTDCCGRVETDPIYNVQRNISVDQKLIPHATPTPTPIPPTPTPTPIPPTPTPVPVCAIKIENRDFDGKLLPGLSGKYEIRARGGAVQPEYLQPSSDPSSARYQYQVMCGWVGTVKLVPDFDYEDSGPFDVGPISPTTPPLVFHLVKRPPLPTATVIPQSTSPTPTPTIDMVHPASALGPTSTPVPTEPPA